MPHVDERPPDSDSAAHAGELSPARAFWFLAPHCQCEPSFCWRRSQLSCPPVSIQKAYPRTSQILSDLVCMLVYRFRLVYIHFLVYCRAAPRRCRPAYATSAKMLTIVRQRVEGSGTMLICGLYTASSEAAIVTWSNQSFERIVNRAQS